jgi:endonuclease IV
MASSDRMIGFSTGALAKGDFRRGLRLLQERGVNAVELSALREEELATLMESLDQLDLRAFDYVSVHSPTKLSQMSEERAVDCLQPAVQRKFPIIVHPEVMQRPEKWSEHLGSLLVIENMDKRKPSGRTAAELAHVFDQLPNAGFCFDVAHAGQVDSTMTEAAQMLRYFGSRMRQVHASGVSTASGHSRLSATASLSISRVSHLVPKEVPIILESPVEEESILSEIEFARRAFSPWLERLRAEIDGIFDLRIQGLRRKQAASFLRTLQMTGAKLTDFEIVISNLPSGGAYQPGDVMLSSRDLLNRLSDEEKAQLNEYLLARARELTVRFPDLQREFSDQFAGIEGR